jgi:transcriptional regulator with XRE-family HTH domain
MMKATTIKIGDLLRRHRLEAGLTQKQLATEIDYHDSLVSRIERGEQQPTEDYVARFITVMQLSEEQTREIWAVYGQTRGGLPTPLAGIQRHQDWGESPDVSIFYGRYDELVRLTQWLVNDRCRLVAILGMGGIGKTALATKLAKQTTEQFDYIIWRSLRNAPPLPEILAETIQFLSDQQEFDFSPDIEKRITRFITYLAKQRCLVVLDNAEAILQTDQAGHYRDGYVEYSRLFQRVGESEHQSCLIVTSREKPREIGQLESDEGPVRGYQLVGLNLEEGRQILVGKGLVGSEEAWATLTSHYSGNPLALSLVAEMIREVYARDIDGFLAEGEIIFGRIGDVIGDQFARLSALEQSLMYWLAIEREPVSREMLLDNLVEPVSKRDLMVALRSLRRRSLIEQSSFEFTLQNVVMEYVTDRLVDRVCHDITTETISLFQSHALIKAQAKDYIRASQIRLILACIGNRLGATFDIESIEDKLMQILATLREAQPRQPGYAGGNAINLLCHLERDVSGFDFSHLAIWQAYLQGVNLLEVNFAHADMAKSVFTRTFGIVASIAFSPNGTLLYHLWRCKTNLG